VKTGERVDERAQEVWLGASSMNYSTGEGGKLKRVRIRIKRTVMVKLIIQE
jgi:hypothetical protein